ncbi:MAG TPA: sulfur carrier protein ThiS [Polyangia bacterium]|jgi:thiamine biosynthesis protein ThiS
MKLVVNGTERDIPDGSTVLDLLGQLGLKPEQVAVERNREIVPRRTFAEAPLAGGDRLEIVTFVGGG